MGKEKIRIKYTYLNADGTEGSVFDRNAWAHRKGAGLMFNLAHAIELLARPNIEAAVYQFLFVLACWRIPTGPEVCYLLERQSRALMAPAADDADEGE